MTCPKCSTGLLVREVVEADLFHIVTGQRCVNCALLLYDPVREVIAYAPQADPQRKGNRPRV